MREAGTRSLLMRWSDALIESDLRSTTKLVGLVLRKWLNSAGSAYPSQATIATGASVSVKTVQKALRELVDAGFLTYRSRSNGRRSNQYQVVMPEDKHPAATSMPDELHRDANPEPSTRQWNDANGEPASHESLNESKKERVRERVVDYCSNCGEEHVLRDLIEDLCSECRSRR